VSLLFEESLFVEESSIPVSYFPLGKELDIRSTTTKEEHLRLFAMLIDRKYVKKCRGCLLWKLATNKDGYGMVNVKLNDGNYKILPAHRVFYSLMGVVIPEAMDIAHSCKHRNCVNPEHLSVKTREENNGDKVRDGTARNERTVGKRRYRRRSSGAVMTTDG
jgi:hypothetical protein